MIRNVPPAPLDITPETTSKEIIAWLDDAEGSLIHARCAPSPHGNLSQILGHPADAELPVHVQRTGGIVDQLMAEMMNMAGLGAKNSFQEDLPASDVITLHWEPTGMLAIVENGLVSPSVDRLVAIVEPGR